MNELLEAYNADCQMGDIQHDERQYHALKGLQGRLDALLEPQTVLERLKIRPRTPISGVYLWGPVGRGKTYLMDLFCEHFPTDRLLRQHFHEFLQWLHGALKALTGKSDPLRRIARELAQQYQVLCFDEFFVEDIGDAMLLGTLFSELFSNGMCLIVTSNTEPDRLYEYGLQRQKFLPAIEAIKDHMEIVPLQGETDYRLTHFAAFEQVYSPISSETDAGMKAYFDRLTHHRYESQKTLTVHGRPVVARYVADSVAWFDFDQLCQTARAAKDYVELAHRFQVVFVAKVPEMGSDGDTEAKRFVFLIDALYDRQVKLVLQSAVPVTHLYIGQQHAHVFHRVISRLTEMQTAEYQALPHRP